MYVSRRGPIICDLCLKNQFLIIEDVDRLVTQNTGFPNYSEISLYMKSMYKRICKKTFIVPKSIAWHAPQVSPFPILICTHPV
jgi:hypothetical protein